MKDYGTTPRRGFLSGIAAAAVAAGLPWNDLAASPRPPMAQDDKDAWLTKQTGAHRCLFDFPLNGAGVPLIHIYNYLETYRQAYGTTKGQVNAIGTFYFVGPSSSLPLAFNDAMWAKYKVGELLNLTDPKTGKPSERNMFVAPQDGDPVLFGGAFKSASMANLMEMGTTFLMCNNAFMIWVSQLAGAGMGTAAAIERELRANMVPGVVTVPAMVIAIEKAQSAGIAYNKQG